MNSLNIFTSENINFLNILSLEEKFNFIYNNVPNKIDFFLLLLIPVILLLNIFINSVIFANFIFYSFFFPFAFIYKKILRYIKLFIRGKKH